MLSYGRHAVKYTSEIDHIVEGFVAYQEGLKDHVEGLRNSQLMNKTNKNFESLLILKC
jgi:hypothetical protein